jgi:glucose/arabinose dehydrogenase
MNVKLLFIGITILITSCNTAHEQKKDINAGTGDGGLSLQEGFSAIVVADDLGHTRHMEVADNGDIYASLSRQVNGGGIVCLRDTTQDGKADIVEYAGAFDGTGIGLRNGYLYFGADTIVVRYKLNPGELVPDSSYEIIVRGFEETHQHSTKPFSFDDNGNIYVTVGAPSNACQEQDRTKGSPGIDPCPILEKFGGIWRFNADRLNQDQMKDGYRYATGIRNAVAIHWNKKEGKLYALQHGRDQLNQFYPELYSEEQSNDLPAEEFLLVEDGSDFGWPYCYYDQLQQKKVLGPEYGGDGNKVDRCEAKDDPILAFPGHIGPNDLLFYTGDMFPEKYKNGAFIAFHGSWNRTEQKGYSVVFVPFNGKIPSGEWEVFADGFAGVDVITNTSDAKHRPCGLAQGPDGSLYVCDDEKGTIWKITYNQS